MTPHTTNSVTVRSVKDCGSSACVHSLRASRSSEQADSRRCDRAFDDVVDVSAAVGVAAVMRGMQRLEADQTFRLANAVGKTGDVYLSIPGERTGTGKVHITIHERLMELDAITPEGEIPTGARVLVIDSIAPATVIVVPQPRILDDGASNA